MSGAAGLGLPVALAASAAGAVAEGVQVSNLGLMKSCWRCSGLQQQWL